MRNSFTYKCAQLWNKLPVDIKLADHDNIFKSKIRSIQLKSLTFFNFLDFIIIIVDLMHVRILNERLCF